MSDMRKPISAQILQVASADARAYVRHVPAADQPIDQAEPPRSAFPRWRRGAGVSRRRSAPRAGADRGRRQAQDRHDRRRQRRRRAGRDIRQGRPSGDVLLAPSRTAEGSGPGAGPNGQGGTVAEAVAFGDVMLLVVPYTAVDRDRQGTRQRARRKRRWSWMSATRSRARRGGLVKRVDDEGGAGLATQKALPGAHIVRAFNAINFDQLAELAHRQGETAACRSPATTRMRWRWRQS